MTLKLRHLALPLTLIISSLSMADTALSPSNMSDTPEICAKLTATGNSEYPPYLWRAAGGSNALLGANRIIMDEIGKRLGVSIQLQDVGSWARAQEMLKSGNIDLLAGAFYTVPRIQYMDYVYPAFLNTTSVVWKKKSTPLSFNGKNDLAGKSGTTVINNSFGQEFDQFAKEKLNIEYVASLQQAFKMITHNRANYALYEKHPGLAYANHWGFTDQLEALEPPVSSEGLYLTISHRSKCNTGVLRGQLAKVTQELIAEGFMQKALQQGLKDWQTSKR